MTAAKEGHARMPKGKRQMLCILDEQVIEQIKIAAVRSNSRISHVVQQALEQWLERAKTYHRRRKPKPNYGFRGGERSLIRSTSSASASLHNVSRVGFAALLRFSISLRRGCRLSSALATNSPCVKPAFTLSLRTFSPRISSRRTKLSEGVLFSSFRPMRANSVRLSAQHESSPIPCR